MFAHIPDGKESCIDSGEIFEVAAGTVLAAENEPTLFFHAVIEGEVRITRNYERQTVLMRVGKAGNLLWRNHAPPEHTLGATIRATKPSRLFRLDEEGFWRMMTQCPTIAREVIQAAATRLRSVEGYTQQREKLASFGTMAAGLAHELNNPAAAARRAAAHLAETADKAQSLLCRLSGSLKADDWRHLINTELNVAAQYRQGPAFGQSRTQRPGAGYRPMARRAWCRVRMDLAPTFVTAGIDTPLLQEFVDKLPPTAQSDALAWLEVRLGLKLLLRQVEQTTTRIAELVKAIKSYTYMDQAPVQEVDISMKESKAR